MSDNLDELGASEGRAAAPAHRLNSCQKCRDWGKWERHEDHAEGVK